MLCNKGHKRSKKLPYGATKGKFWCWGCDAEKVSSWTKPLKKRERQAAKRKINQELKEGQS